MLNVLAVSDQEEAVVHSPQLRARFGDSDVVLSCGDLPYTYLEYITTMLPVQCLYVHGNHDRKQLLSNGQTLNSPGGWQNIDGTTVIVKGWIIGGLEGCIRYRPHAPYQYSEKEMKRKMQRMALTLLYNRVIHGHYIDILITHAPPLGIHDGKDLPHRGFDTLLTFMQRFEPRYLLHGHQHRINIDRWHTTCGQTEVVNVYPYRRLELSKE